MTYLLDPAANMTRAGPTVSAGNYFQKFIGGQIGEPVICASEGSETNFLWYENTHSHFQSRGCYGHILYVQGH